MKAFLRDTVMTLIIAAVIFFGLQYVVQKFVVDGPSMNFTLHNGQHLLVNKVVYRFREPERGDVIVFRAPNNQRDDYIKRIIGLPGESVEIKEGTVYIHQENGTVFPLDESYIEESARQSFRGRTIPGNEYFVLGDNRNNSLDSRNGWTLPRENIIGKAWISLWRPEWWGFMPDYVYGRE